MGRAFRLFRVSYQIHGFKSSQLRVPDSFDLLLHVQHIRNQHGSAIQRRWPMERLPLWRTCLHYPQLRGEIGLGLARIHRSVLTFLTDRILL